LRVALISTPTGWASSMLLILGRPRDSVQPIGKNLQNILQNPLHLSDTLDKMEAVMEADTPTTALDAKGRDKGPRPLRPSLILICKVRSATAGLGPVRRVRARRAVAWCGWSRQGKVRSSTGALWLDQVGQGEPRPAEAWRGGAGQARAGQEPVRSGQARQGPAGSGTVGPGRARHGFKEGSYTWQLRH
jgi:hypothetical protein